MFISRGNPDLSRDTGNAHAQRKVRVRTQQDRGICKPKTETSEETNPANTLILDFEAPEL